MSSGYLKFLSIFALFIFLFVNLSSATPSVHDLLPQYGLPQGLVPDSVKSYSLSEDGSFEIELQKPCYVQFDRLVYYEKKITGRISYGAISNLSGIQAKKLFIWVSVTAIKMLPPDYIEFDVGPLSEKLSAKQFETIPSCKNKGCSMEKEELVTTNVAEA